ncbi:hypothetical protein IFM89_008068 [Coptis chinensis]|uniref:Reverse transcriptase zinc-binding domain-containing protein n=1 Tax=Coptis chinensis TaxID=261450 RepID=A0A835M9C6_9MAGN|nr:hypothetical protein IFM89_008068 [Coptis chinensis]
MLKNYVSFLRKGAIIHNSLDRKYVKIGARDILTIPKGDLVAVMVGGLFQACFFIRNYSASTDGLGYNNHINTDDRMQIMKFILALRCITCKDNMDTQSHTFYKCGFARQCWNYATHTFAMQQIPECYWLLPPIGVLEVRAAGSTGGSFGIIGWGFFCRDHTGRVHGVGAGGMGVDTTHNVNCQAILEGVTQATSMG